MPPRGPLRRVKHERKLRRLVVLPQPFLVQLMITFGAYYGFVKSKAALHRINMRGQPLQLHHIYEGKRVQLHFHIFKPPGLAHLFVAGRHRVAQPGQNGVQGWAVLYRRFQLLAHLIVAGRGRGPLEGEHMAGTVRPFLTAQTQQAAAFQQGAVGRVKDPVALKMRAQAVRAAVRQGLTQGL